MMKARRRFLCGICVLAVLFSGCAKDFSQKDKDTVSGTGSQEISVTSGTSEATVTTISEAVPAKSKPLNLGVNLEGPADWGVSWPLNDIMKLSRPFFTQNLVWVEDGINAWDTEVIDRIPKGNDGYPLELPVVFEGMEAPQIITTVWANTVSMPDGDYRVYYEGKGKIAFGLDATGEDLGDGRMIMHLSYENNIASMSVVESSADDPIRNIRIYVPGSDPEELFNPVFLEKCEPFSVIRFMDWGDTNNSKLSEWGDRSVTDDITFTTGKGYPYEYMIELANLLHKDVWICIPHLADDEYIKNLSKLLYNELDPDLNVYIEYSNEIWNWMFDQTNYLYENGDPEVEWPEKIVPFIQNALDVFYDSWPGDKTRVFRVVGVQVGWYDVCERIVLSMREGSFDIISPTSYFGFNEEAIAALEEAGVNADMPLLEQLAMDSVESIGAEIQLVADLCNRLGVKMAYYEGGQHLTPDPFGSEQPYGQALVDIQHDPAMYDIYTKWLEELGKIKVDANGDTTLCMLFTLASGDSARYGSFGLYSDIYHQVDIDTIPKYKAVRDYMEGRNE